MSDIVEEVARAIRKDDGCGLSLSFGGETVFCDDARLPTELQDADCGCKSKARAAIRATLMHLRENVSDEMVLVGFATIGDDPMPGNVEFTFAAMLTAALQEIDNPQDIQSAEANRNLSHESGKDAS